MIRIIKLPIVDDKLYVHKFSINLEDYDDFILKLENRYSNVEKIRGKNSSWNHSDSLPRYLGNIKNGRVLWWKPIEEKKVEDSETTKLQEDWRFSTKKFGGNFDITFNADVKYPPYLTKLLDETIDANFISLIDLYNYMVCISNLGEEYYYIDMISYNREMRKLEKEGGAKYIARRNLVPNSNPMLFKGVNTLEESITLSDMNTIKNQLLSIIGFPIETEEYNIHNGEILVPSTMGTKEYKQLKKYIAYGEVNNELLGKIEKILWGDTITPNNNRLVKKP